MAEPRCQFFGQCGGCSFQHVDYADQVENKRRQLVNAIGHEDIRLFTGSEYNYRNRMDLVFHSGGIGLRRKGSWHQIVDIPRCEIATGKINTLVEEVRSFFTGVDYFNLRKNSGTYRYAVVRTPGGDSSVSIVLNADSTKLLQAREKISEFAERTSARNVLITYVPHKTDMSISADYYVVKGSDELQSVIQGREFTFNAQGFFQNNDEMIEAMQAYVREIFRRCDTAGTHLVDLYGGVGTFGIINADLFERVSVVESFPQAVVSARRNIEANGAGNVHALELDAKRLKNAELPGRLTFITDPPRSGMNPRTITALTRLAPELIVYVSCNVKQLGRDLKKFSDYRIASAALFDFFPHTPHSEAVVELVREGETGGDEAD
ncbi:MAG: 23S rRNA (uracil(1939)-C(5))-methyltransferase RlmD [Candidatus Glassbacteria bacterium]|nr:23S rRNA (uracil(1939)-C(5))-methyltransferase RlmD [Candidatus Glassbacteria bacterium]